MSMFEEAPTSQATPACRPRRMDLVGKACLAAAWNGAHPGGRPESDHPCGCHGRPNIPSPSQGVGRAGMRLRSCRTRVGSERLARIAPFHTMRIEHDAIALDERLVGVRSTRPPNAGSVRQARPESPRYGRRSQARTGWRSRARHAGEPVSMRVAGQGAFVLSPSNSLRTGCAQRSRSTAAVSVPLRGGGPGCARRRLSRERVGTSGRGGDASSA